MSRRRWSVALQVVAMVAAAAVAFVILIERRQELLRIADLGPVPLLAASALTLANYAVGAIQLRTLVARFGARLDHTESLLLVMAGYALNYLPMKAGTFAQGIALRSRRNVRLTHFGALSAAGQLVSLWAAGTTAGAFAVSTSSSRALSWILAVGPTILLAGLVVWARARRSAGSPLPESRWMNRLFSAAEGFSELLGDPRMLGMLVAANLAAVVLVSARLYVIIGALGESVTPAQAAIAGAFSVAGYVVSVLPGGLGFKEGGIVGGALLAGIDPSAALAAALIDRGVDVLWVLLAGVPSAVWLGRAASPPGSGAR